MKENVPVRTGASVFAPSDILTPSELCKRLKVPRTWVYDKLRDYQKNPIPVFRIGHHLRFNWPEVCAWLETTRNRKPV